MKLHVYQNASVQDKKDPDSGDYNLRIAFEEHLTSPVRCTAWNTPELIGLKQLLDRNFSGQNYVLTHGDSCELRPAVPSKDTHTVAQTLIPQVIELLQNLGHTPIQTEKPL